MMPRKGKLHGKDIIILEELPEGIIWIEEEDLFKPCEEIFEEVRADLDHPLRGKRLIDAIRDDVEDRMGWGKYKPYLKRRGWL